MSLIGSRLLVAITALLLVSTQAWSSGFLDVNNGNKAAKENNVDSDITSDDAATDVMDAADTDSADASEAEDNSDGADDAKIASEDGEDEDEVDTDAEADEDVIPDSKRAKIDDADVQRRYAAAAEAEAKQEAADGAKIQADLEAAKSQLRGEGIDDVKAVKQDGPIIATSIGKASSLIGGQVALDKLDADFVKGDADSEVETQRKQAGDSLTDDEAESSETSADVNGADGSESQDADEKAAEEEMSDDSAKKTTKKTQKKMKKSKVQKNMKMKAKSKVEKTQKQKKAAFLQMRDSEDDDEEVGADEGDALVDTEDESSEDGGLDESEDTSATQSEDAGSDDSSSESSDAAEAVEDAASTSDGNEDATAEDNDNAAIENLSLEQSSKGHESEHGSLSEEAAESEFGGISMSGDNDIGLDQLTSMDGTDAEAARIAKMASARNPDEALEKEMDENGERDADGEYADLDSHYEHEIEM